VTNYECTAHVLLQWQIVTQTIPIFISIIEQRYMWHYPADRGMSVPHVPARVGTMCAWGGGGGVVNHMVVGPCPLGYTGSVLHFL
jgi:hypothetical protein